MANTPPFGHILVYCQSKTGLAEIKGIEAVAMTFFDFLPAACAGSARRESPEYPRDVRWEASLISVGVWFRF